MKKYIKFSALAAAALLTGVACQKEAFNPESDSQADGNFTVTFICDDPAKTYLNEEDASFWWSKGDQILFAQNAVVSGTETYKGLYTTLDESTNIYEFTSSKFNEPDDGTEAAYFSMYPYSAYAAKTTSKGIIFPRITLPDTQKPSIDGYDPAADILISKYIISDKKETSLKLQYKRMVSFGRMTIKNIPGNPEIASVTFSAVKGGEDVVLAGSRFYDLVNGEISPLSSTSCTKLTSVTLDYTESSVSGDFDAYITCLPFELGEGDSFKVIVEDKNGKTYTKDVDLKDEFKFVRGQYTTFTVNFNPCSWFSLGKSSTANTISEAYWTAMKTDASVTVASIKDVAVTKAEFEAIDDLDAYVEANGTAWGEKDITSINNGTKLKSTINKCKIDTEYVVILKVTDSDGRSALLTYNTRTDWCKVALVTRSGGGVQLQYYVKNVTAKSKAYRVVPTSTLEGITDLEDYYLNTLKPGTQPQETIDAINAKDGAGYFLGVTKYHTGSGTETAAMVSGTSYTVLVKFVNSRGESAFRSAAAVAK